MAKGQLRSNREKKKPKQNTAPGNPAATRVAPLRPPMPPLVKKREA
jgi:hypothetical protein